MNFRFSPVAFALLGFACFAAGCSTVDSRGIDLLGPVYEPKNVRGPALWPPNFTRVAVFPAHDATQRLPAGFVSVFDETWRRSLSRSQRSEFINLSRASLLTWTGKETVDAAGLFPPGLLARIQAETGAQAALFLELNNCTAYPPLALAFRARLVQIDTGVTLWMADELFDGGEATTARGARRFAMARSPREDALDDGILHSPSRFSEYAFAAVVDCFPPRVATESEKKR
jgi:hypothetical protein